MRAFLFALLGGFGLIVSYWLFDREPPVAIEKYHVVGPVVPGQDIIVSWTIVRKRSCYTFIEKINFDGKNTREILPDADMESPGALGRSTYRTRTPLSDKAEPGKGSSILTLSWRCNPTHRIWPVQSTFVIPLLIRPHAR